MMYYEMEDIEKALKCAFCSSRFQGVVKQIPDCAGSICGECAEDLADYLDESGRFKCKRCDRLHTLPADGLRDNEALLAIIQLRPKEKQMSTEARSLKLLIDDARDKISLLKSIDGEERINSYCDSLEMEVIVSVESAITHLNQLMNGFLSEINEYRSKLLKPFKSNSKDGLNGRQNAQAELDSLSQKMDVLHQEWDGFFTRMSQLATEAAILQAQDQLKQLIVDADRLKSKLESGLFGESLLKFKENQSFCQTQNILGSLVEEFSPENFLNTTGKILRSFTGHTSYINQIIFLPNGNLASCSSEKLIKIWDIETGTRLGELIGHTGSVNSLAGLENGLLASASNDMSIIVWDVNKQMILRTLVGHTGVVYSLQVLKNGRLASCSADDSIMIWNPHAKSAVPIRSMKGHGIRYHGCHLGLLSNNTLVTVSRRDSGDQTSFIRLWNPETGELLKSVLTKSYKACSLAVLSDDRIAVGFDDGSIKIFDHTDLSNTHTIEMSHRGGVRCLLPASKRLLISSGSSVDPTLKIWDLSSFELLKTITTQHSSNIYALSISQGGKYLASGSDDKSIKLWSFGCN